MLAGVEFVADKDKKTPFARGLKVAERFADNAKDAGLIIWPNYGQWRGEGDLALIAPPFVITEQEIDQLVSLFSEAWDKTLEQTKAARRTP